ncbi:sporulation YhaL family protein [Evansella clarkii]|jgi:Na+/melibiose symporter-like transporter|uniref:sporulation YhaL family protein n=1 Tax=Evansella clarkii TaxID=79879 RepID=UPI0009966828|nr:sporulation YhaL family protein [Evansella clarkii]
MRPSVVIFPVIGLVIIGVVLWQFAAAAGGPAHWWIYGIYLAIVFCAVMFIQTRLADEKAEQKLIEEEGEEFLRKYKEKRQQ